MKNEINIFIASKNDNDNGRIPAALSIQNEFHIVGVEKNEVDAIIKSERLKPDVIVLDFPPPGMSGYELAPIIHRRTPETAIVMLCEEDEQNYAGLALKAGIAAFLIKEKDIDKLASVISIVYNGGYYISAPIFNKIISAFSYINNFPGQSFSQASNRDILSPIERGIIIDLAQGLSYDEAAKHLHYSVGTLKNYMSIIKRKTKLKNRMQIVIYSLVYGLISIDQLGFKPKAPWDIIEEKRLAEEPAESEKP